MNLEVNVLKGFAGHYALSWQQVAVQRLLAYFLSEITITTCLTVSAYIFALVTSLCFLSIWVLVFHVKIEREVAIERHCYISEILLAPNKWSKKIIRRAAVQQTYVFGNLVLKVGFSVGWEVFLGGRRAGFPRCLLVRKAWRQNESQIFIISTITVFIKASSQSTNCQYSYHCPEILYFKYFNRGTPFYLARVKTIDSCRRQFCRYTGTPNYLKTKNLINLMSLGTCQKVYTVV